MKGKASEIPVKNFRIADDEKAGDVKELPARPVHGRFSNNEVVDATATAAATVAARTPDTPLSEVYSDPNAATQAEADAAAAAGVEVPQVNGAANGAAAADGSASDRPGEAHPDEPKLEGEAADIAAENPDFEYKYYQLTGDVRDTLIRFGKVIPNTWGKMNGDQEGMVLDLAGDYAVTITTKAVNLAVAQGFPRYEVTLNKWTVDRTKETIELKCSIHLSDEATTDLCNGRLFTLVISDDKHLGRGKKPEATKIGSLGLPVPEKKADTIVVPTSGPGTPTFFEVMDAVGKGPEAAAVVAAAVAAADEPAPAPTTVA